MIGLYILFGFQLAALILIGLAIMDVVKAVNELREEVGSTLWGIFHPNQPPNGDGPVPPTGTPTD